MRTEAATDPLSRADASAGESPQDQLRREVREAVVASPEALTDWVTLGGATGDVPALAIVAEAIDAASVCDDDRLNIALGGVLAAGLELRDGMFLGGNHFVVYYQLRHMDAEATAHVVCESCRLVFRPLRKLPVRKCDRCDKSRALPPFTRQEHADGRGYSYAGLFSGTTHVRICKCCEESFRAGTATTFYCGGAARRRPVRVEIVAANARRSRRSTPRRCDRQ